MTELHKSSNLRFLSLSLDREFDGEKLKYLMQLTNLHDLTVHIRARDCDKVKKSLIEIALKLQAFSFKCIPLVTVDIFVSCTYTLHTFYK